MLMVDCDYGFLVCKFYQRINLIILVFKVFNILINIYFRGSNFFIVEDIQLFLIEIKDGIYVYVSLSNLIMVVFNDKIYQSQKCECCI